MMDKIQATKEGWQFWVSLPSAARAVIAIALPLVAVAGFVTWFVIAQPINNSGIERNLKEWNIENRDNWERQFRFNDDVKKAIDTLKTESRSLKTDVSDLTIITAANSNNRLLGELLPYLQGSRQGIEETYRIVLDIQRSMLRGDTLSRSTFNLQIKPLQ